VKRLFIEVQYNEVEAEVDEIHCSGSEWCELNLLERFLFS